MTTSASIPSAAAAKASACAWLPAEIEITPRAFSSGESDASLLKTPRGLNEPVRWKSSALRKTSAPVSPDSVRELNVGVRWTRSPMTARAARTSSRENGSGTAGSYVAGSSRLRVPRRSSR